MCVSKPKTLRGRREGDGDKNANESTSNIATVCTVHVHIWITVTAQQSSDKMFPFIHGYQVSESNYETHTAFLDKCVGLFLCCVRTWNGRRTCRECSWACVHSWSRWTPWFCSAGPSGLSRNYGQTSIWSVQSCHCQPPYQSETVEPASMRTVVTARGTGYCWPLMAALTLPVLTSTSRPMIWLLMLPEADNKG